MFEYFETWFGYLRTGYKTSVAAFKTGRSIWKPVRVTVEQTLHFVLEENLSYWTIGGVGLGTRICCQWHVTNSSHREIVILKAQISGHDARHSEVLTECGLGVGPHLAIPPGEIARVTVGLAITPPIFHNRNPQNVNVVLTDNYECEHILKVRLPFLGSAAS